MNHKHVKFGPKQATSSQSAETRKAKYIIKYKTSRLENLTVLGT